MVVCSHCGRESRAGDRFCQHCGQQLEPSNGHLVAAFVPRYIAANEESQDWHGPLAEGAAGSAAQHSDTSNGASSQPSRHGRLLVRPVPEIQGSAPLHQEDANAQEYELDGRDIAIGRAPSCDVILEGDQLASRRHALMRRKGDVYTIVDLGSSNGTYVNELEIREATVLKEGDIITVGAHEILFSTTPASPNASTPGGSAVSETASAPGETDPSAAALPLSIPPWLPTGESSANATEAEGAVEDDAAEVVASPDAHAAPAADDAAPAPEATDTRSDQPDAASQENAAAEDQPATDAEAAAGAEPVAVSPVGVAAGSPSSSGDLEALRMQLAEISAALARKADEEARAAERLRSAVAEARDRLAMLSQRQFSQTEPVAQGSVPPPANVSELASIARQAAENPRHLDYLTSLAARASEIASVLQSLEEHQVSAQPVSNSAEMLEVVNELRARLDAALKQG